MRKSYIEIVWADKKAKLNVKQFVIAPSFRCEGHTYSESVGFPQEIRDFIDKLNEKGYSHTAYLLPFEVGRSGCLYFTKNNWGKCIP